MMKNPQSYHTGNYDFFVFVFVLQFRHWKVHLKFVSISNKEHSSVCANKVHSTEFWLPDACFVAPYFFFLVLLCLIHISVNCTLNHLDYLLQFHQVCWNSSCNHNHIKHEGVFYCPRFCYSVPSSKGQWSHTNRCDNEAEHQYNN